MKKIHALLLSFLLVLSVCGVRLPAAAEERHTATLYVYGDLAAYDENSAMFLTAGASFWVRQEVDGIPVEPPVIPAPGVTIDPAPCRLGPDVFGREGNTYYRCTVAEDAPTGMGFSTYYPVSVPAGDGHAAIEGNAAGCGLIYAEHKEVCIETRDGRSIESGGTLLLQPDETVLLRFSLTGGDTIPSGAWSMEANQTLIAGWFAQGLRAAGFTVPEDPVIEDGVVYCSVSAAGAAPGTEATLPIHFVMAKQIFGAQPVGWENASVVYRGEVKVRVAGEPAVLRGDADLDGEVTAMDARLALRRSVDLETFQPGSAPFAACDLDGDGAVTALEARLILRASVDLETL